MNNTHYCKARSGCEGLPNNLRFYRQQANMTQGELAEIVDCHRRTIGYIETGEHDPSVQMAYRIAAYFEVAMEMIFPDNYPKLSAQESERSFSWNVIMKSLPLILTVPYVLASGPTAENPISHLSIILRNGNPMATSSSSGPAALAKHSPTQSIGAKATDWNSMPSTITFRRLWNTMVVIAEKLPATGILMIEI